MKNTQQLETQLKEQLAMIYMLFGGEYKLETEIKDNQAVLTKITARKQNEFKGIDGRTDELDTLLRYELSNTDVYIPRVITKIEDNAFYYLHCDNVRFHLENIKEMGEVVFDTCDNSVEFIFNSKVRNLDMRQFSTGSFDTYSNLKITWKDKEDKPGQQSLLGINSKYNIRIFNNNHYRFIIGNDIEEIIN